MTRSGLCETNLLLQLWASDGDSVETYFKWDHLLLVPVGWEFSYSTGKKPFADTLVAQPLLNSLEMDEICFN